MEAQDNNYYVPSLGDFYIGYEYEQNAPIWWAAEEWNKAHPNNAIEAGAYVAEDRWTKRVFGEPLMMGDSLSKNIIKGLIRTPYLTHQQILADGWEQEMGKDGPVEGAYKKGNYWLVHSRLYKHWAIIPIDPAKEDEYGHYHRYTGVIPSINELRQIEKLLQL